MGLSITLACNLARIVLEYLLPPFDSKENLNHMISSGVLDAVALLACVLTYGPIWYAGALMASWVYAVEILPEIGFAGCGSTEPH